MTTLENLKFTLNKKEEELKQFNLNQFILNREIISLTEEIKELNERIKQEEDKKYE